MTKKQDEMLSDPPGVRRVTTVVAWAPLMNDEQRKVAEDAVDAYQHLAPDDVHDLLDIPDKEELPPPPALRIARISQCPILVCYHEEQVFDLAYRLDDQADDLMKQADPQDEKLARRMWYAGRRVSDTLRMNLTVEGHGLPELEEPK